MIILLWPTIRPSVMRTTHAEWINKAANDVQIITKVVVDSYVHAEALDGMDVKVINNPRRGVTHPCYMLSRELQADEQDIVILASDDIFAPQDWDKWLVAELHNKIGGLLVNDGYIRQPCMTVPIMTFGCLLKLNRIIYHTSYLHQYSDNELYHNLVDLNLLIDARDYSPIFEHRHWCRNMRSSDEHDHYIAKVANIDAETWSRRCAMPVHERLTINE